MPKGFYTASASIFARLSGYKGSAMPDLEDVLCILLMQKQDV
jgi:hypothetical protein